MTWRTGKTVAINVYDGDRPVCQCHTVADAKLIVSAVNSKLIAAEVDAEIERAVGQTQKPGSRTP